MKMYTKYSVIAQTNIEPLNVMLLLDHKCKCSALNHSLTCSLWTAWASRRILGRLMTWDVKPGWRCVCKSGIWLKSPPGGLLFSHRCQNTTVLPRLIVPQWHVNCNNTFLFGCRELCCPNKTRSSHSRVWILYSQSVLFFCLNLLFWHRYVRCCVEHSRMLYN